MHSASTATVKDVVLVGGGHSHVHVLKMFGMKPMPGVRLTLITRDVDTPYSGMLPGHVAGFYTKEECHIDLAKLARFAKAQLLHVPASGIDLENKLVFCADGRPPIPYDILSIDIGSSPTLLNGHDPLITPVKPIDGFSARWDIILQRILGAQDDAPVRVVVVGGGAGGVELSLAMHHRLRTELAKIGKSPDLAHVALVTQGAAILENHNLRVQQMVLEEFQTKNITVHVNSCVVSSETDDRGCKYLVTTAGEKISFDECVWCTSANGQQWIRATGLEVTEDGFICVQDTLQTTKHPDVFACGDCCHMVNNPRPKSGVFAVRQGPFINNNIRHMLLNEPLEPYIPQSQWLGLIGTGDGRCVASRGPIALKGEYLWQLKDFIDRGWMRGYQELPSMMMAAPAVPDVAQASGEHALRMLSQAAMRCGGCGSKVGSSILSRALANVRPLNLHRDEIVAGLDSPDDVALIQPPGPGYLLVQTVDFFKNFLSDPFLFGKIAANHALSDCHAKNAAALSAMAIVVLPYGFEEKMEATLTQILAGACQVLSQAGCALVGGHTSEGEDLALGFAITGTVAVSSVLRKGGVQNGYSLVLTKSVGTGTLMAADMRVKARGVWVDAAIQSMLQSNSGAAAILHDHGCAACTDVTGFGLIGHLLEMLQASATKEQSGSAYGAKLLLDQIPILPGAVECVQQGIFSSLQPQNIRNRRAVVAPEAFAEDPRYPLLFDPQTAGGLLAAVPSGRAAECVAALKGAGYVAAAVIGEITELLAGTDELIELRL